ncbi:MAG TPA: hypothetical protein VM841_04510 [Actinomycetota bacterium]|nr:hypothetical protein [Actinomycetota bacterium]
MPPRILLLAAALLASLLGPARALPPLPAGSQVIVSSTLNGTLHVFDASTLAETQPPLAVKGTSPVRLWVERFGARALLLSANHGVQGSLGVYDLDTPIVTELPLSPFASGGQGSVGIAAGTHAATGAAMIFLTDTVQALGGCGLPEGTITGFDARLLATAGVATRFATVSSGGPVPYAVAFDGRRGEVLASNYCNDTFVRLAVAGTGALGDGYGMRPFGTASTGAGPDAVLYDGAYDRAYVTNIRGDSVSVFASGGHTAAVTTVPLPGAGPIDAALADSPSGARWMITSNGADDTVSLIDRDAIAACAATAVSPCHAEVARIGAGVPGGAPEGVAYDPATNRIFVVNKTIGAPALSVIQLDESGPAVQGQHIATIPLRVLGAGTPLPDITAFDVVVRPR